MAEEGIHKMRLTGVSDPVLSSFKKPNGDDKWQVILTFQIDDEDSDSDGEELRFYASISMHPKSNMYPVVKALLGGQEIDADQEIDLDDLIGKHVLGTVTHVQKPSRNNPGQMATFANLTGFAPLRKKKKTVEPAPSKTAKPAPKAAAQTDDDEDVWDDADTDEDAA